MDRALACWPKPAPPRERQVQKQGLDLLRRSGIFCFETYQPTGRLRRGAYQTATGVADILGCHHGRMFAVECKLPQGRQSNDQRYWQERLKAAGGLYWIARSLDDFEGIVRELRTLDWGTRDATVPLL